MQQKKNYKKNSIGPILFLYHGESLVSSNLNSNILWFHCAHPNVHRYKVSSCPVHVIWTGHRMSKLVLNVKYLLLLSYLTAAQFYNLGHIQGIIRVS
jgi:hypothetical protein